MTRADEIRELGRCIRAVVESERPTGMLTLGWTMSTLTKANLDLLKKMQTEYGLERCNRWMVRVLNGTTVFGDSLTAESAMPRQWDGWL